MATAGFAFLLWYIISVAVRPTEGRDDARQCAVGSPPNLRGPILFQIGKINK